MSKQSYSPTLILLALLAKNQLSENTLATDSNKKPHNKKEVEKLLMGDEEPKQPKQNKHSNHQKYSIHQNHLTSNSFHQRESRRSEKQPSEKSSSNSFR